MILIIIIFINTYLTQTITNASLPQKRKGYWSIIVWTISSKYGRIDSNLNISVNSMGNRVGHQHIAKFLLSMLFNFEFSETLKGSDNFINPLCRMFLMALVLSYRTKCWKMNFRTAKLAGGSLLKRLRNDISRQLLSVFTSMFMLFVVLVRVPAISSNSFINSGSNSGGKCLEKKSFSAVATAFTGISSFSISMSEPKRN